MENRFQIEKTSSRCDDWILLEAIKILQGIAI